MSSQDVYRISVCGEQRRHFEFIAQMTANEASALSEKLDAHPKVVLYSIQRVSPHTHDETLAEIEKRLEIKFP